MGSLSTIRRFPAYLHLLKQLNRNGREFVSSTYMATELKIQPDQIRKDLAVTGIVGKPKAGYHVPSLVQAIEEFLGWNNVTDAFIVGTGNLGSALLGYEGFGQHGLNIVAAFDSDETKVGRMVKGFQTMPMEKLGDLAVRMRVRMGIIAVPADAAQEVADALIASGVVGIWNFAPISLTVPDGVIVQNEDLSSGLAVLSVRLARALVPSAELDDIEA